MADTRFIKREVEPYIRKWLSRKFRGIPVIEKSMGFQSGSHKFDGVSIDETIVASFLCNRPKTGAGNENTGAVRKALNDLQYLRLIKANKRLIVCTDKDFLALIKKRACRIGTDGIEFVFCPLPDSLRQRLEIVLNECRKEQA